MIPPRDTPRTVPDERSLAHSVLIADGYRRSALRDRDGVSEGRGERAMKVQEVILRGRVRAVSAPPARTVLWFRHAIRG